MGGANTALTAVDARHLLRRTGFGATPADVGKYAGLTRGAAADELLGYRASKTKPSGRYAQNLHDAWVRKMISVRHPLQEKLVLFWHDHFATSYGKVGSVKFMANQNRTLRYHSRGNFRALLNAIHIDAAMLEFLDTVRNRAEEPNENYARELMELFTLGVFDFTGEPNYLQSDVVQIARAFSGWRYDWGTGSPFFDEWEHDFAADHPSRGPKVIFSERGGFGPSGRSFVPAGGEGEGEIAEVTEILLAHRDSEGKVTTARRITRRLLEFFCHGGYAAATPAVKTIVDDLVAASGFDATWELTPLLRELFVNDAFYDQAATPSSVKWPIDYVVGTFRMLKMKPKGRWAYVDGGEYRGVYDMLADMGQVVFEPPSVFGWNWELSWINSATLLARAGFARDVAAARGRSSNHLRPEKLMSLELTDPDDILDSAAEVLGIKDLLGAAERAALIAYLTDDGAVSSLDLTDWDVRNGKLHGLFALLIQSPVFQLH